MDTVCCVIWTVFALLVWIGLPCDVVSFCYVIWPKFAMRYEQCLIRDVDSVF